MTVSPLTYVNNIKTPMMFILGEADSQDSADGWVARCSSGR